MMPGRFSLKGRLSSRWNNLFLRAVDLDRWNHIAEAISNYEKCATTMENDVLQFKEAFSENQLYNIKKACACCRVRMKTLQSMNRGEPLTLSEMERLMPLMKNFLAWKAPFPLVYHHDDSSSASSVRSLYDINQNGDDDEELIATTNIKGKPLLPMIPAQTGKHRFTIRINSVGLKHPERLSEPFLSISVKDDVGINLTPTQEIRCMSIDGNSAIFGQEIHIQRYLEDIFKGSAIYFELKHHKMKQTLIDTKCFTFLEPKAIHTGDFLLNQFKKPVQYSKRKLVPMTTKPLHLSFYVTVHDC